MAFFHSKLMAIRLPRVSDQKGFLINRPVIPATATKTRALDLFQDRGEEKQKIRNPKTISVSRRDAMLYMTAEILSGFALLSTEPAEARIGKQERKRQIMEKLEKLREKAGVSKTKTEYGLRLPPPRPMNPQQGSIGPLVEVTLP